MVSDRPDHPRSPAALTRVESHSGGGRLEGDVTAATAVDAHLRRIIDTIPVLAWCSLPDGSIDFLNQRWQDYTGLSQDEACGWGWQAAFHPDDLGPLMETWRALLASGEPGEIEARLRRRDGAYRWFLIRAEPFRDDLGRIVRWYGTSTDIDDLKGAQVALQRDQEELRLITDALPQAIAILSPEGLPLYTNQVASDYTGVTLEDVGAEDYRTRVFHPEDVERLREDRQAALTHPVPFSNEQRIRGRDGRYRWFLMQYNPLLDADGKIVRWYSAATDIEDRKRAEEAVSRQQRELRETLDLVPHHIAVIGADGTLIYANRAVLEHYGWTTEHVQHSKVDRLMRDIADADDAEAFLAASERGFARGSDWEVEARTRRRDGVYRCFLVRANPLRDDTGRIARWYLTATDIDDRRKAEDKIRQQERELREIVDVVPHHIAVATPDGTRIYGNRVMLDYYGLTREDVQDAEIEALVRHFMHPDDAEPFLASWERGFAGTAPWETESRFRRRDGEYRWFLVRVTPLRDAEGRILRWYVTGTDIDDRKKADDKVRQDERELRMVVDFVPQHLVEVDLRGRTLYANRAALEFTGLTLEQTVTHPDVWSEIIHPDHLDTVRAVLGGLADGVAGEVEFRLRRHDGQYRWILGRTAPVRDAQGRVVRGYASGMDIDDRKRVEERAREESVALREEVDKASMFEEIVGTSPRLRIVRASISRVAPSDATVLITGETGTGKELVARAIHKRSKRQARAFVSVNCAAIPPTLIASELFGHEKGAFTGALARRLGRFELADGGTLFLDEIGDLPLDTQVALLRVLQEGEFERVGSTRSIHVNLRIIAATNRDLRAAVTSGAFRADLFYRLNVFPIEVPPLWERPTDIPLLVSYFVDRYARKAGKTIRHVDKCTLELIQAYRWPGNVRELQNVIERAVILCDTDTLVVDESWLPRESLATRPQVLPLGDALVAREREMIEAALAESKGKVSGPSGAAAKLGIPASTLDSKISLLKIPKDQFKGT